MVRAGFTLVEVIVALVILEVGMLGVVGTLVVASRAVRQATTLEGAVARTERVIDSLAVAGTEGSGSSALPGGDLAWIVEAGGTIRVSFVRGGSSVLEVWSHVDAPRLP